MGPDVVVGCTDGPLRPGVLWEAVSRLQMQYATLRCRVEHGQLVVGGPLPVAVEWVDGDWRDHAELELSRPLRLHDGEAFRVIRTPGAVILSVHHALVDGTSLLRMLGDLLEHCRAVAMGEPAEWVCEPLAPAVLDAVSGPRWHDWVAPFAGWLAPWVVESDQRTLLAEGAREGRVHSVTVFGEGTREGLARLVGSCRAHGVTVGAAAMAAASFATGRFRAERSSRLAPVPIEVEVDLRRRADPPLPSNRVGFHTGASRTATPQADLDFWSLAQALKTDVERDIHYGLPRFAHALAERLDWAPREAPGAWVALSNLGRVATPLAHGPLRLTGIFGMNGAVPGGPAVMLWLRCVDGRLCFNAVGSAPTVDREALQRIGRDFMAILEAPRALRIGEWASRTAVRAA
jgi:hypothetical protein